MANLRSKKDEEDVHPEKFDPFLERYVEHPTSDCDTLVHLLKGSLGTGILGMPYAFKNAGLTVGVVATIFVAVVCTHCAYILVKCAHELYYRSRVTAMSFGEVGVAAFSTGPKWARRFTGTARLTILCSLGLTYFGTCSVYTVIVAKNLKQVIETYHEFDLNVRVYIVALMVPLVLLCWVRNLKHLAPFSLLANVLMAVGIGITFYYIFREPAHFEKREQYAPLHQLPHFFSTTIFAIEAIGVVMPLENSMRTPRHFLGWHGVLNTGMVAVTIIYTVLGFSGYLAYGDNTEGSITINLPTTEIAAQSVKVLIALAVFFTYGLQYYVCLEIVWNATKSRFVSRPLLMEYVVRTLLVIATVIVAAAIPSIGPFMGLVGSVCFSILGLICPAVIEVVTYWDINKEWFWWRISKNAFICLFGTMAFSFGTYTSVQDIIELYSKS